MSDTAETARDLALSQLSENQRKQLMEWAADNAIAANDPLWSYFLATGFLQQWQQQQMLAAESAVQHIRAQHKTSVEQLQAATVAAARAAKVEIKKSAAELSKTLAENISHQIRGAIRQAAAGESRSDKIFRFVAPVVATVGAVLVLAVLLLKAGYINPPATDQQINATSWFQALAKHWEQIPLEIRQEIQSTEAAERAARRGGN